jgi:hypothetical protein
MPANNQRPVDLIVGAFDLNQRRKFVVTSDAGDAVLELYFKPITRADRKKATALAESDEALEVSTQLLCQKAELKDGTKAFAAADAAKLQRELPERVLNELELFLFGIGGDTNIEEAKKD